MDKHPIILKILKILKENGKKESDILFVGARKTEQICSWSEFTQRIESDVPRSGATYNPKTATGFPLIVVVGDGWWIERFHIMYKNICFGNWIFMEPPKLYENAQPIDFGRNVLN